jgi:hypothetical protein
MKCADCKAPTGKRSDYYCDYCRGWRAGYQAVAMRHKRGADPAMREAEREAVKARMRKLRALRKVRAA